MSRNLYTYIGAGQVYLRRRDQSFGLLPVGDASELQLAIETDSLTLKQHSQPGGGNLDKVERISAMNLSLTLSELDSANVAMALYGDSAVVAAGAVAAESHANVVPGALLVLNNQPDTSVDFVVTNADATTTYVEGTDYNSTALGIVPIVGGGIASDSTVLISYTKLGTSVVQMITNSGYEYELVFEGLNEANGGIAQPLILYRCKFSPTSGLGLITEDFGNLALSGEVLVDSSKTGAGISRYGKMWLPQ